jgi:exodeoxyribonuclease V beta subunit
MQPFDAMAVPLDGRILVEASAGTGKTHAITTLFLRLVVERGAPVDRILVVTFTEAATAELKMRLRARLSSALSAFEEGTAADPEVASLLDRAADRELATARLRYALRNVDEAAVHTIHGFCQRMLHDCAFESGTELDAELVTDLSPLFDEVVRDYWTRELAGASRARVLLMRSERLTPDVCRELASKVVQNPYMPVLPERVPLVEEPSTGAFLDAFRRVGDRWDRARIEQQLLDSAALKRSRYRKDKIAGWCDEMDGYLALGPPPIPQLFAHFGHFRATELAAAVKQRRENQQPRGPFYTACDWLARAVEEYQRHAAGQVLAFRRRLVDWVRAELPRRKLRAGVMAFDDLLLRLHDALAGPRGERLAGALRRRYPVALVDEFQDTDPIQYAIFDRIWPDGSLFLIGDPKQAIYAFRGADVFAYLRAAREVTVARRYTMGVNWRSDPSLVRAVSTLLGAPASPFLLEAIQLPGIEPALQAVDRIEGPALRILFVRREGKSTIRKATAGDKLPHAVAAEIAALLSSAGTIDERAISAGDIAVLTRSNAQAFDVQRALQKLAVRSVVLGDQSVFEDAQPDAREVEQVLTAVAEPTHTPHLRAALTSSLFGLAADDLARMETDSGDASLDAWIARFRDWHARWVERGFVQMFRSLLAEAGVIERLLLGPDGERRVTNLIHLHELLHTAASTLHLGPAGLLSWLRAERAQARARPESAQIRLESDERAVRITTVHRSKGLEYPIVYAPYLWDGRLSSPADGRELSFHDPTRDEELALTLAPGDAERERAELERLAESIRLAYVALTRARHRCTVVWGAFTGFETSALGYMFHPPVLAPRSPSVDDVRGQLVDLDDERMLRDLAALVAEEPAVEVQELDLEADRRVAPLQPSANRVTLEERRLRRKVTRWWRTASFTELTRKSAQLDDDHARDRDQMAEVVEEARPPSEDERAIVLADFPRGARAGNFFHDLFEHMEFSEPLRDRAATERRAVAALAAYRYHPALVDAVVQSLADVVATPLTMPGERPVTLADVPMAQRLNELEFHLPVASASLQRVVPRGTQLELSFSRAASEGGTRARLSASRLAAVFADHPSAEVGSSYAARVARLGFLPLEGFLKGFIDLVFARHGRYYLCDYKTSHLGDTLGAYARERLGDAMAHSHYHLQSHLYALALHRYLVRRQPGYHYEKHFGGILYLFIKGMTPSRGAQTGVYFERPPRARLDALSDLLDHPGGAP